MNIESICSRHVFGLDVDESPGRVVAPMREHHAGGITVTDDIAGAAPVPDARPVGTVPARAT